jgi:hypothetical protein
MALPRDSLKIGESSFRKIVAAISRKGTYNQGLSYFYVDFIEMIALVLKMLDRIWSIVKRNSKIKKEDRDEIETWVKPARENTQLSSQYLRHGLHLDLKKSTTDGYCCVAFALGQPCEHDHSFEKNEKLPLAYCNHAILLYLCKLTMEKLMDTMHDDDYCELVEKIYSMQALADLSGKEMLFYAKHIARGWWMTTAINELKKLLMKHPCWLKGVIMDYKNKLIPIMKNEPISLFFVL